MDKESLKYWYDKDGNKVYGNPKKYNENLEYLLSNNPEEVITREDIDKRARYHNLFVRTIPNLSTISMLKVVRRAPIPEGRRVIFAMTHGFRDDIALAMKTIPVQANLVYASIPDFFYSIDGQVLSKYGVYLMDRRDKESKAALIPKIMRGFDLGLDYCAMCPEGVWNKDPNLLVLKLWPGIYRIAKEANALVMPLSSVNKDMKIDRIIFKRSYSILGEPIDVTSCSEEEGLRLIRDGMATYKYELMEKYFKYKRKKIGDGDIYWNNYVQELIKSSHGLYDYSVENSAEYMPKGEVCEADVFAPMKDITVTCDNAMVYSKTFNVYRKQKKY